MGRLPIYCCTETAILLGCHQNIQEGHGTNCPGIFTGELDILIYGVDVIQEAFLCADLMTVNVSSTYLFHREGVMY